ncbi:MAG: hypothetical protein ACREQY_00900, partial [Candidatus Binatia bacterium]
MRASILTLAAILAGAAPALAARIVTIGAGDLGPLNRQLGGTTHGSANVLVKQKVADLGVPHIRIDTWLDTGPYACVKDSEGRPVVDFTAIDERVQNVRDTGAEPLVIVDYMPRCLS